MWHGIRKKGRERICNKHDCNLDSAYQISSNATRGITILMNTQFLEIYRCEGMIVGTPLRATTTYQCRLEYENCFNLPGKCACFFLVSRDDTIRRDEAIAFAASIAAGKMVLHHIDLSTWTTKGVIE